MGRVKSAERIFGAPELPCAGLRMSGEPGKRTGMERRREARGPRWPRLCAKSWEVGRTENRVFCVLGAVGKLVSKSALPKRLKSPTKALRLTGELRASFAVAA